MISKFNQVFLSFNLLLIVFLTYLNTVDIENMQIQVNQLQRQVSAQQEQIKLLDAESVKTWRERMKVE